MKIQFLTDWKHEGEDYEKDDRRSFDDATGEFFCRAGIGKDLSGKVKTEAPNANESITLDVQPIKQTEVITNA